MSSQQLQVQPALTPQECGEIDRFCQSGAGAVPLPALAQFLKDRLATDLVLDQDIIGGFAKDSSNLPGQAGGLCRPKSERECAAILRACSRAGIPCTISAGRSNLTGSATPEGGVVISTVQMMTPEVRVDMDSKTVRAPVGIILEDLRREVLKQSGGTLIFPVDPTSRADATVGGALACNASGFTPGEIGAIRHWVKSIDFLLPDGFKITARRGELVSRDGRFLLQRDGREITWPVPRYSRPPIKNAGGPFSAPSGELDFVDLVVGSEGLFGLVTACTLQLAERPSDYLDLFFSLPAEENAIVFLDYLRSNLKGGLGSLSALEYFGVNCRRFMTHEQRLFRGNNQVGVYIQVPLTGQTADDAAAEWFERLVASACGLDEDAVMILDNDRDRAMFMEARHSMPANAVEVVQHHGTYTIMTDTVVPPDRFREFLAFTHNIIRAEKLDYLSFGHLGDCHLHFTILPEQAQLKRATEIYDAIVAESARLGGVYSGEHGTGKRKRRDFLQCYGPDAVEQVRQCKGAVDPDFILNRGNVVPARA